MTGRTLRTGFTILETTAALGILVVLLTLVAQVGLWSLRERTQAAARYQALEFAANILEAARACPWEELTPQWATRQRLPDDLAGLLARGRLEVRVEPETSCPYCKRVTVEVYGERVATGREPGVRLVGWFSARTAAGGRTKP